MISHSFLIQYQKILILLQVGWMGYVMATVVMHPVQISTQAPLGRIAIKWLKETLLMLCI